MKRTIFLFVIFIEFSYRLLAQDPIGTFAAYYFTDPSKQSSITAVGLTNLASKYLVAFQGTFTWYDELNNETEAMIITLSSDTPALIGTDGTQQKVIIVPNSQLYFLFLSNAFGKTGCVGLDGDALQGKIDKGFIVLTNDTNHARYSFSSIKVLYSNGSIWSQ